jgi:hypothetical protein
MPSASNSSAKLMEQGGTVWGDANHVERSGAHQTLSDDYLIGSWPASDDIRRPDRLRKISRNPFLLGSLIPTLQIGITL